MSNPVSSQVLDQAFRTARSFNKFKPEPVADDVLRQLHELLKWGPTAMNAQPARFLFLQSQQAKQRLKPALSPNNIDKTLNAPLVVVVAADTRFYEHLATQFPAYDARPMFESNPASAEATAQRNSSLQGAYLIIAARLLGLDVGPMSGFDAEKLNAEFFPDGRFKANFLLNMGYGDDTGNHPRGPRLSFETAVQVL